MKYSDEWRALIESREFPPLQAIVDYAKKVGAETPPRFWGVFDKVVAARAGYKDVETVEDVF